MAKQHKVIAISAPVEITAGESEGEKKGPAKFTTTFYTGGAMNIEGWDAPVVIDLSGLDRGNVLVANLDHERSKRVGNFSVNNDGKTLVANGIASAATAARDEVVNSAIEGYQWQSSLEVNPSKVEELKAGKTATVNGQEIVGPAYITRKGILKGFAFVSHGADDNTTVSIAASAASKKGNVMETACEKWIESMGFDIETLSDDQKAGLVANYEGKNGKKAKPVIASNPFEARKLEAKRQNDIREIADKFMEKRPNDIEYIEAVEKMVEHAIETKMEARDFRAEMYEQQVPLAHTVPTPRGRGDRGITERVLMAAVCEAGRLQNLDKHFKDEELQAAHSTFRDGISLNQFFIMAAEANGFRGTTGGRMTLDVQRAAFGQTSARQIQAQGFSTIDVANITGAIANKFIHEGWMGVDQTALRIAAIKSVRNFQTATTVSLTGALQYEEIGAAGEIKHGTTDEQVYTNQAKTYGLMLAITRQDIINDDLGALTAVPRRLGRGAMLLLNHIFWTEFMGLEGAGFFASGNANINTGVADMTVGGLDATETIFMNQTDYDGKPLGIQPAIILVPTALKNKALTLMGSMQNAAAITSYAAATGADNPFVGRWRVESSPYMSNSAYTGYSAAEWYMLANPSELAVIEIAALNGRVEPTVDQADTDFNTLGVQYRGYSDVGVNSQEKKAGVLADGGSS
jgi:hypothetical protein